ncbi:MAG: ribosomal-processing cysteine protease Prp [Anaerostipes sp.]|nr:ribosomal-processing cysteine protease Prp [Anaerostipes sp.]
MIEISIRKDGVTVSGHANYAPRGQDIVCAAVSTLALALIKSIENLTEDKIQYSISSGMVDIEYKNLSEKSKTLVDSFFVGVSMVSNDYPNHVRMI